MNQSEPLSSPACPYCKTPLPNTKQLMLVFHSVACGACNSIIKLRGGRVISIVNAVIGFFAGVYLSRFGFSTVFIGLLVAAVGLLYSVDFFLLKVGLVPRERIRLKYAKPHVSNDEWGSTQPERPT